MPGPCNGVIWFYILSALGDYIFSIQKWSHGGKGLYESGRFELDLRMIGEGNEGGGVLRVANREVSRIGGIVRL